jgi:hypothetical protein
VVVAIGCRWEGSGAGPQFFGTVLDSAASAVFDRRVAVEPLAASSKFRGYTVFVYFQRAFRTELRTDFIGPIPINSAVQLLRMELYGSATDAK